MRQYLKFVFVTISCFIVLSCSVDILEPVSGDEGNAEQITIVSRVARFSDCNVDTRGIKSDKEDDITSMAVAIFPVNESGNAIDGTCVYYQYMPNDPELMFIIDRGQYTPNAKYAIYVFANISGLEDIGEGDTLEEMLGLLSNEVSGIGLPQNGFPMIGSLGDTFSDKIDRDNRTLILCPMTSEGKITAPKVTTGDVTEELTILPIPLKALYAKINFTIKVNPDQTVEGKQPPMFSIEDYTVNNIPASVDFDKLTNSDTDVLEGSITLVPEGNLYASTTTGDINFSFYLPERLLTPSVDYDYPFNEKDENNKQLYQRYKPKLVGSGQKATNVVISGRFRDHQGHFSDVDYTIYLGENESDDFNIRRNVEYNNTITIRGIQASAPDSDEDNLVYVDHRVNITRTQPAVISLHREVLLDSHYEIRPLRITQNGLVTGTGINAVKVEILNPTVTDWMRLERSSGVGTDYAGKTNGNGESIYITDAGASKGKRRYFTHNLITGTSADDYDYPLNESTEVIVPLSIMGDCVWIYVDECTDFGDDVRSGVVKVTYGSVVNNTFKETTNAEYPPVEYTISQRKLFRVKGGDSNRNYDIEYYEEYLHNYDADEEFGHTDYEGMEWGLNNIQLSYDNDALFFDSYLGLDFMNNILNYIRSNAGVNTKYDFYVKKHDSDFVSDQAEFYEYNGYEFSKDIIQVVNGYQNHDTDLSNNIDILPLNVQPRSAVEYCYNKNKRDSEGHVLTGTNTTNLKWYLPAIDEIEDIVMSTYANNGIQNNTYGRFPEFQEKYYWSSQPAYIRNYAQAKVWMLFTITYRGAYYYDDVQYARATRVTRTNNQYEYERSGVTSYYHAVLIDESQNSTIQTEGTVPIGNNNSIILGEIIREPGNKPRTSKARVRCVRRIGN